MEYIQGLSVQTRLFAYFFALGFMLGLLYDILRFLRVIAFKPRKKVFVLDAVFGSIAAIISFLCLLALNHGQVQIFILLAQVLGLMVYIFSLGGAMSRFRNGLIWTKRKTIDTVARPVKFLSRKIRDADALITAKFQKLLIKSGDFVKNHLHSKDRLRYNIRDDSWADELLQEEESRIPGGKAKGKSFRVREKNTRQAFKRKKAAQQAADNRGGFVRGNLNVQDGDANKRHRRNKNPDSSNTEKNKRNSKRKRKIRGRIAPD